MTGYLHILWCCARTAVNDTIQRIPSPSLPQIRDREDQRLKIAVIGAPGTGKTTLVSALANIDVRQSDLDEDDIGGPRRYFDPEVPNIIYNDFSGVELPDAKSDEYYNLYLAPCDVFIIVTALRVQEIDLALLEGIVKKLGKTVLFVRSKIDQDVENFKESFGLQMDEDDLIGRIKSNIEENIRQKSFGEVPVFILSSIQSHKWDFEKLKLKLDSLQTRSDH